MNILIIEDEVLAAERLKFLLNQYDPSINVMGCLESITETVQWLQTKAHPDLLLMDIQLSDGHSFEIFKQAVVNKPVIFTTAFDNYAIEAFRHFSIDYILKPVTAESLTAAIEKYKLISNQFTVPDYSAWTNNYKQKFTPQYKDRFLAKVGPRTFFIQTQQVAYFYADNKIVYLADHDGNKYIINYSIEKLEPLLEPHHFFRINRSVIVHSKSIELIKPYFNNRLKLCLRSQGSEDDFIVSRERVNAFKKWADS